MARVVAMMSELEDAEDIEPGAKFEAFTYVDGYWRWTSFATWAAYCVEDRDSL